MTWILQLIYTLVLLPSLVVSQADCPAAANPMSERGWASYRIGEIEQAREAFDSALSRCPDHLGARNGRGYVALRDGDERAAADAFAYVRQRDSIVEADL